MGETNFKLDLQGQPPGRGFPWGRGCRKKRGAVSREEGDPGRGLFHTGDTPCLSPRVNELDQINSNRTDSVCCA